MDGALVQLNKLYPEPMRERRNVMVKLRPLSLVVNLGKKDIPIPFHQLPPAGSSSLRELTKGGTVVMDEEYFSFVRKPFDNERITAVVRQKSTNENLWSIKDRFPSVVVFKNITELVEYARNQANRGLRVYVLGGQKLQEACMSYAEMMYITRFNRDMFEGAPFDGLPSHDNLKDGEWQLLYTGSKVSPFERYVRKSK